MRSGIVCKFAECMRRIIYWPIDDLHFDTFNSQLVEVPEQIHLHGVLMVPRVFCFGLLAN